MSRFGSTRFDVESGLPGQPSRVEPSFVADWRGDVPPKTIGDVAPVETIWNRYDGEAWCRGNNRKETLPTLLAEQLGPQPGRIVNFMCGQYAFCSTTLGVDINAHALQANREIAYALVHDVDDPSRQLPIADGSFDNAVMLSGIAYLRNPQHLFNEVRRIVAPGGNFFVGFDACSSPEVAPQWEALDSDGRLAFLKSLGEGSGLVFSRVASQSIWGFQNGIVEWPYHLAQIRIPRM